MSTADEAKTWLMDFLVKQESGENSLNWNSHNKANHRRKENYLPNGWVTFESKMDPPPVFTRILVELLIAQLDASTGCGLLCYPIHYWGWDEHPSSNRAFL